MKRLLFVFFIILCVNAYSQNDCVDAIVVCGSSDYVDLNATGVGVQELSGSNTCSSQENNSIWLRIKVNTGGTLGFTIVPTKSDGSVNNDINVDFDFFIFGPNATCSNIGQAIRCSTTNPLSSGQSDNLTGLRSSDSDISEGPGQDGNSFVKWLSVAGGDSYFLVIDRPIGSSNFRIDWTGSAKFNAPPVATAPSVGTTYNLGKCDDDGVVDNSTEFDLSVNSSAIIGSQRNVEVLYFTSNNDAQTGNNAIRDPSKFKNTSDPQTIYARIKNLRTDCFSITDFSVDVEDSLAFIVNDIKECDDDTDGILNFDLTQNDEVIINGQTNMEVSYYESENDALYSMNPIIGNYPNTSNPQIIWARLENAIGGCFGVNSFAIEVFEMPNIQYNMVFKNCDEDGIPDGFTDYNLDEANNYITNGNTSLNVTYYTSIADADLGSNPVNSSPFNNANTIGKKVYARIETVNGCHRISTIDLQASTTTPLVGYSYFLESCDDDDIIDGLNLFDLSIASADMIDQFPTGENLRVQYYRDLNDAQLEQNEILPQNAYMSETPFSQTLYVRVESDDNGECFGIGPYLTLTVFPRPNFEVIPTAIVCLNLPPITLEAYNPGGVYSYEWTDENNMPISNTSTVDVATGGVYTVIATSTDGNNCESYPHTITVNESIVATIDYDDVIITDDSDNNTVTINNENNNLGVGDYEFSLNDEFGPYQDEPFFDSVTPGIHIIYVRDKNNCGIAMLEISVIGFPKFFTPNNDGYNDNWQVLGISQDFFPTSLIYIFDRFGKIIAKIDPLSTGWNGFYNGEMLPSDDYWFSVQLIDINGINRNRIGYFSLIRR